MFLLVLCLSISCSFPLYYILIFPSVCGISQHWLLVLINLSYVFNLSVSTVSFPLHQNIPNTLYFLEKTKLLLASVLPPISQCLIYLLLLTPRFSEECIFSFSSLSSPSFIFLLQSGFCTLPSIKMDLQ